MQPTTWQPSILSRDKSLASALPCNDEPNGWGLIIDNTLSAWQHASTEIQDLGIVPPSAATFSQAIDLARQLRDQGLPPPTSVVPDPNGGIVFQRQEQNVAEEYHIWDDGAIEYRRFEGQRVVERRTIARGKRVSEGTEPIADDELLYRRVPAA